MRLGRGELRIRDTHVVAKCRVCYEDMVHDDVSCKFSINREDMHFHRICMKNWLEYGFDVLPPTEREIAMDPTGELGRIEVGRKHREFTEYRQRLIERLQFHDRT